MVVFISAFEENAKVCNRTPSDKPPPKNSYLQIRPWELIEGFTVLQYQYCKFRSQNFVATHNVMS